MEKTIKTEECSSRKTEFIKTESPHDKREKSTIKEKKSKAADNILNRKTKNDNSDNNKNRKSSEVLKRKFTEDGIAIERVLSEGETSSGFETVSSIDSNADIDDLELSSLSDYHNNSRDKFNVIVQIENELAYRNNREPEKRIFPWNDCKSVTHNHKRDYSSNEYKKRKHDRNRCSKEKKHWGSSIENKHYKSEKKKWSSEGEGIDYSRQLGSQYCDRKSRRSDLRSRCRSREHSHKHRNSRSPERSVWCSSSNNKERKTELRHSGSSDKYSSNSRRNSPPKKRRRSSVSRSPSSVWSRLDSRNSPVEVKKEEINISKKDSFSKSSRRKERTPFLVELERKLKEAERLKNSKQESTNGSKDQTKTADVKNVASMLQVPVAIHQNPVPLYPSVLPTIPAVQGVYPLQYQAMPPLSVDNLPLVPGPTGLPVHITVAGEQIPHDMDGKRIPIGPNGFYLPVDPTGRLFAHIISPGNQAIPIHMTDDGVLRLPNSAPVPFGPSHQLPVNTDGSVIFIGPDSKPLFPCPNLPREPPLNLLNMMNTFYGENLSEQQTVQMVPQAVQMIPETEIVQVVQTQSQPLPQLQPSQNNTQVKIQSSESNPNVSNFAQKVGVLKSCEKVSEEKAGNNFEDIETDQNFGTGPRVGVKRSIPLKLSQKKAHKDHNHRSGSDKTLIFGESASKFKSESERTNGSNEDVALGSEENQGFLEIVCGNKSFTIPTADLYSDDPIVRKTQHAIKSLSEKNYKPPVFGRFIISDLFSDLVGKKCPNESPLTRNRIKLPFVTPNAKDFHCPKQPVEAKETKVTFKFLPQKSEKGDKSLGFKYNRLHSNSAAKFPVFTFDFAVQCDFTSVIIKNLNSKITELEMEVVRLRNVNSNLLDDCRNAQVRNERKSDELRKAMLQIQERNCEIKALKCSLEMQQ